MDIYILNSERQARMIIFFLIIGIAAVIFCGALGLLIYQVRSGQLDDMDTPPLRMLAGDDVLNINKDEG